MVAGSHHEQLKKLTVKSRKYSKFGPIKADDVQVIHELFMKISNGQVRELLFKLKIRLPVANYFLEMQLITTSNIYQLDATRITGIAFYDQTNV